MSKAELILIGLGLVIVFCLSVAALAIADAKSKTPAAPASYDPSCYFKPKVKPWEHSYVTCAIMQTEK